jgi:hypothetical protein
MPFLMLPMIEKGEPRLVLEITQRAQTFRGEQNANIIKCVFSYVL